MRILDWKAHHDHTTAVMFLKVDTFGDLATRNGEVNRPTTDVTRFTVFLQSLLCLHHVLLLDKQKLVSHQLFNNTQVKPLLQQMLHVHVRWEEAQYAVGYDPCQADEQLAI